MNIASQIIPLLHSQSLPTPTRAWLNGIVSSRTPPPPLTSLVATARIRLLAADFTTPGLLEDEYVTQHSLPANLSNPEAQKKQLSRDVVVQVLDIEDISRSRWEQVEDLEAIERGEQTRGREIIRLPVGGEDENEEGVERGSEANTQVPDQQSPQIPGGAASQAQRQRNGGENTRKNATHKLIVQDCQGQKVFALELARVEKIGVGKTNIGEKILLRRGATVSRGMILLEPGSCVILGGKVEAWQKSWVEGRLARLREAVGADGRQ